MSALADDVLPLIRTRTDLHRWSASNAHGRQMHEAVDILEREVDFRGADPVEVHRVTHRALTSALKVIARADDSSGIIGDACSRLLALHPRTAAAAHVSPTTLVDWMVDFHFGDNDVDFFELDPVAYGPALGAEGMRLFRARLEEISRRLGPEPKRSDRWQSDHAHEWFVLGRLAQRLAVHDRDVDEIVRTHIGDRTVAAWFTDTATALEEIGEIDLAIDWARQGVDIGPGHQSLRAGEHWCRLLAQHRPEDLADARLEVFRRWPTSTTAEGVHASAGRRWSNLRVEVMDALRSVPDEAVSFALSTLRDPTLAWTLAHDLAVSSATTWDRVVTAYEIIDPIAALPVHTELVETELESAGAEHYRRAARRLAHMRTLAAGTPQAPAVNDLIAGLRETHRRRPRLQQEFTRAGLP